MLYNSHFHPKILAPEFKLCDVERRRDKSQHMLFGYPFHSALGSAKESAYLGKDFCHQQGGKSSCLAHHPSSAHTSFIPHPLQVQSEARSDFALWRHGIGMAQRDTAPEVTELQHCLLEHLIGKSIPSCSFPRARRQSNAGEAASY